MIFSKWFVQSLCLIVFLCSTHSCKSVPCGSSDYGDTRIEGTWWVVDRQKVLTHDKYYLSLTFRDGAVTIDSWDDYGIWKGKMAYEWAGDGVIYLHELKEEERFRYKYHGKDEDVAWNSTDVLIHVIFRNEKMFFYGGSFLDGGNKHVFDSEFSREMPTRKTWKPEI